MSEDTKQLLENVIAISQASSDDSGRKYHLSTSLSLNNSDLLKENKLDMESNDRLS